MPGEEYHPVGLYGTGDSGNNTELRCCGAGLAASGPYTGFAALLGAVVLVVLPGAVVVGVLLGAVVLVVVVVLPGGVVVVTGVVVLVVVLLGAVGLLALTAPTGRDIANAATSAAAKAVNRRIVVRIHVSMRQLTAFSLYQPLTWRFNKRRPRPGQIQHGSPGLPAAPYHTASNTERSGLSVGRLDGFCRSEGQQPTSAELTGLVPDG